MAYRPTERTEARKRAQYQLISDSALSIVANGGFKELTIASVAQKADVATGTIYKYFQNKEELCTHVFCRGSGQEVDQVRASAFPKNADELSCEERFRKAVISFYERAISGRKLAYALIAEPVDTAVDAQRLIYRKAYADIFRDLLAEGMQKGEFQKANTSLIATAIVGVLSESLVAPLHHSAPAISEEEKHQLSQDILTFCLRAVSSDKD